MVTIEKSKELIEWENKERAVTLTNGLWSSLTCFLIMTTHYREKEAEAWEELSQEKDENGMPVFRNAKSNAEFWREMIQKLDKIKAEIDK